MRFSVCLAQINPVLGDFTRNLERHLEIIEIARSQGAELCVFPELSLTGYFLKDLHDLLHIAVVRNPHINANPHLIVGPV